MVNLQIGIPPAQIRNITSVTSCRNIFNNQVCQDFSRVGQQSEQKQVILTDNGKNNFKYLDIKLLNPKISEIIKTLIINVNSSSYCFDISDIETGYLFKNEPGNYTDWYVDFGEDEITTTRKLTALLFLSEAKDYQGGGLTFLVGAENTTYEQGTVLIFPSYHLYKFEAVLKGTQQVFICWALGPHFH
jgi:hypothetical protein